MVHIKRLNENMSKEYSMSVLENLLDNTDLSVRIVECGGNTKYKNDELIEYVRDFFVEVKGMQETCNGYNELKLGDRNMTYNITVYDENEEVYGWFDFQFIYFNTDSEETLQRYLDNIQ